MRAVRTAGTENVSKEVKVNSQRAESADEQLALRKKQASERENNGEKAIMAEDVVILRVQLKGIERAHPSEITEGYDRIEVGRYRSEDDQDSITPAELSR